MQHERHIEGAGFRLRPARLSDSEFILSLRTQPQLSRYLHPVSGRLEDQQAWMQTYFERPGDFYFVVERADSQEAVGTIALVDVEGPGGSAEWGRWILSPESMAAFREQCAPHFELQKGGVFRLVPLTAADFKLFYFRKGTYS